jgi:hypothetical protein
MCDILFISKKALFRHYLSIKPNYRMMQLKLTEHETHSNIERLLLNPEP